MAQDLRELLKGKNLENKTLSKKHENKFEAMLEDAMPLEEKYFFK